MKREQQSLRTLHFAPRVLSFVILLTVLMTGMLSRPGRAETSPGYSDGEQRFLLGLARNAIVHYVGRGEVLRIDEDEVPEALRLKRGCFVTLHKGPNHMLRGCIGSLAPRDELYLGVIDNAIKAATRDPRFPRVRLSEMETINIEISVLTVPADLQFESGKDLLSKLRPHQDGVILNYRNCRSTYLPQVWEQLSDPVTFLSRLCTKGGCPDDCWSRKGARIKTYQAVYFSEPGAVKEKAPHKTKGGSPE